MLASLRHIVQEVNGARSLAEVLEIIVKELKATLNVGVALFICSTLEKNAMY